MNHGLDVYQNHAADRIPNWHPVRNSVRYGPRSNPGFGFRRFHEHHHLPVQRQVGIADGRRQTR